MARPLRIEFPGAYYHVMNRGAGRRRIYIHDDHRHAFLDLLGEAHEMFRTVIHAYCLMDNHYHLLLSTPDGNLNRIMRHINGVYTQRHNRSTKTDGPLFRGRYKALLVDADSYLLSVSRYIHLNPVAAGIVRRAHEFPWSSYRAYINRAAPPEWLHKAPTLSMIGRRASSARYREFVEQGVDAQTHEFYEKKKWASIMGSASFIEKLQKRVARHQEIPDSKTVRRPISIDKVVDLTARHFTVHRNEVLTAARGRGQANIARVAAMYLCRHMTGRSLAEIATRFGLGHYGSVAGQVSRIKSARGRDPLLDKMLRELEDKIIKEKT